MRLRPALVHLLYVYVYLCPTKPEIEKLVTEDTNLQLVKLDHTQKLT